MKIDIKKNLFVFEEHLGTHQHLYDKSEYYEHVFSITSAQQKYVELQHCCREKKYFHELKIDGKITKVVVNSIFSFLLIERKT